MASHAALRDSARPASGRERARLALTEFLLGCDDRAECAQRAIEWLAERTGTRWAIATMIDGDAARLTGIAGFRVPPSVVESFSLDLERSDAPLAQAFSGAGSVVVPPRRRGRARGLPDDAPFLAVPMPPVERKGMGRVGLLLSSDQSPAGRREAEWVATVLGLRLLELRAFRSLSDTERRLGRERTLLNSIIDSVTDPILLTDTEGRLILFNSRAEMLFASQEGESEGRRRAVALNNMLFSAALSKVGIIETLPERRELALVDPSEGSDLLFELLSSIVSDPREGTLIVSVLRNVTDLRRATREIEENYRKLRVAEMNIRAERDRLNLIIDSVADPILVTDPSGNIVLMNAPAERLFTVESKGEVAERAVRANDARFSSFVSNLFFGGSGLRRRGEFSLVDPETGSDIAFEAISGKILSEHGEITAVVTILHDRTEAIEKAQLYEQVKRSSIELEEKVREATAELVRQNELLRRQHLELEQASALKSQFLANMSHEFRTPLNAILGYTSMLLQGVGGELAQGQRKNLGRVDSNAQHLLSIINDLLDISRIEAGKMPLHLSDFLLSDLIHEVMAEAEPLIGRTRLAVTHKVEPGMPPIRSDRQKVKQIVLNLLSNALKFTPEGSVELRATWDMAEDRFAIAVQDTGIGIAEEDQQKVFEDFRQVDNSPSRQFGGAGLGLAICRRLAAMLNGRLMLQSKLGRGSTFTLELPRKLRQK